MMVGTWPQLVAMMPLLTIERTGVEMGMVRATHKCTGRQVSRRGIATTDGPMEKVLECSLEPWRVTDINNIDWTDGWQWNARREHGLVVTVT